MNSVKLLYNKAIIKSDLKKYWWLGAGFAVMLFLFLTMPFLERCITSGDTFNHYNNAIFKESLFGTYSDNTIGVCLIIPAVIGAFLFSYLHSQSMVITTHGYPLRRETQFLSHIISGMIMIAGAIAVNMLILALFRMDYAVWMQLRLKFILFWGLYMLLYSTLIFSLSVMCAMAVGNMFAGFILTYVMMFLPMFIESIGLELMSEYMHGYTTPMISLTDKLYLDIHALTTGGIIFYIILTIVFMAVAVLLYKKRNLENHSSVVAFKILRPVLIYSFAVCIGFIGYYYGGMIDDLNIPFMIAFGIAGVIAAKMLIDLSFKPRKILKPIIIYCIFTAVLFMGLAFDITGYEKRVPKPENVEYVIMNQSFVRQDYLNDEMKITNPETIKNVTELHRLASASKHDEKDDGTYLRKSIYISYKLKNGTTLQRNYITDDFKEEFAKVYNDEAFKKSLFVPLFDPEISIKRAVFQSDVFGNLYIADAETQKEIVAAAKKDAMLISHDEYYTKSSWDIGLSLDTSTELDRQKRKDYRYIDRFSGSSYYFNVYPSSENLKAIFDKTDLVGEAEEKAGTISIDEIAISDTAKRRFICERILYSKKYAPNTGKEAVDTMEYDAQTGSWMSKTNPAPEKHVKPAAETVNDGYIYVKISDRNVKMDCTAEELTMLLG